MNYRKKAFAILSKLVKMSNLEDSSFWDFIKDYYQIESRKHLTEEQWKVVANRLDAAQNSDKVLGSLIDKVELFKGNPVVAGTDATASVDGKEVEVKSYTSSPKRPDEIFVKAQEVKEESQEEILPSQYFQNLADEAALQSQINEIRRSFSQEGICLGTRPDGTRYYDSPLDEIEMQRRIDEEIKRYQDLKADNERNPGDSKHLQEAEMMF